MMYHCPHCGFSLPTSLNDGISYCSKCNHVFNSSIYNQMLSAAWQIRLENISFEKLKWQLKDESLAIFVYSFVSEYNYTQERFIEFLKKIGINQKLA